MAEYKVVEKFISINGEGVLAGQLAVFIRFQGCNLACSFCDTAWANSCDAPYTIMTEDEIYEYIKETGVRNITLTGGEPLLQKDIEVLLRTLGSDPDLRIEIETNGSVGIGQFSGIGSSITFTMDYKLPGSLMEDRMDESNFGVLAKEDTVKFVAGSMEDLEKAEEIINAHGLTEKCHVYISPVFGKIGLESIVDFMKEKRLNGVNMQLQMHKVIWNPEARGV